MREAWVNVYEHTQMLPLETRAQHISREMARWMRSRHIISPAVGRSLYAVRIRAKAQPADLARCVNSRPQPPEATLETGRWEGEE